VAVGLGLAARLDGIDKKIYCIIGDGESREGQIAEALDMLVEQRLARVLPIFNCNQYGQADKVSRQQSAETIAAKLQATGFDVRVVDGHDPEELKAAFDAFTAMPADAERPMALVARTVKGWGSPTMQGGGWHGKPAEAAQLERAKAELEERRSELTTALTETDRFTIQPPPQAPQREVRTGELPPLAATMKKYDMESVLHTGKLATRKAYGLALRAMGHVNDRVVVLDADVSNSTFAEYFKKDASLRDRFIECKIAKQNMFSVAAGLSAGGYIPMA